MAVLFNPNQNNEEENQQAQPQQITNPGNANSSSGQQVGQPQTSPTGTSSGRFTNLSNYIKANQGFNKAQGGLAGKINTNIQNQGQQVTQNVANAVQSFNQKTQDVGKQAGSAQVSAQNIVQATGAPQNQADVSAVSNLINNNYSGPSSLQDLDGQQSQLSLEAQNKNLADTTKLGQTESGRYNLLRSMFNRPTYSSGQQNLDNLLIQGNKDQLKAIQDSRKISGQVGQNLSDALQKTGQSAQQASKDYAAAQQGALSTLNKGVTDLNSDISSRVQRARAEENAGISKLQEKFANGTLTAYDLAHLNGAGDQFHEGDYLYGVDPKDFISATNQASVENVANQEDYSKIQALKNLLGNKSSQDASKILAQLSDSSKAGTYDPTFNFDSGGFQRALGEKKTGYQNQVADTNKGYGQQRNTIDSQLAELNEVLNNPFIGTAAKNDTLNSINNLQHTKQVLESNYQAQLEALKKLMGNQFHLAQGPNEAIEGNGSNDVFTGVR